MHQIEAYFYLFGEISGLGLPAIARAAFSVILLSKSNHSPEVQQRWGNSIGGTSFGIVDMSDLFGNGVASRGKQVGHHERIDCSEGAARK
jgi:hypothetical protein